ncbi:hypothetical protein CYMTET_53022 [Cymbomonas tetramitiformis]|uniref:beta-galactoside alpha-(2,6)-sialyltransferase n=1 Tax=Cymbomonas tetramitiformis TaxID=36881 RepID=A0AAE0BIY5_9CHLO|nr:hypothetical protein CYMTET_53022 [Cymbomonas tetramitiformis]
MAAQDMFSDFLVKPDSMLRISNLSTSYRDETSKSYVDKGHSSAQRQSDQNASTRALEFARSPTSLAPLTPISVLNDEAEGPAGGPADARRPNSSGRLHFAALPARVPKINHEAKQLAISQRTGSFWVDMPKRYRMERFRHASYSAMMHAHVPMTPVQAIAASLGIPAHIKGKHRDAAILERQVSTITTAEELEEAVRDAEENDKNQSRFTTIGLDDTGRIAKNDSSTCLAPCGDRGVCRARKCLCVLAAAGAACEKPRELPEGLESHFNGSIIFNRARLRQLPAPYVLQYKCNPRKSGGSHHFELPVSREMLRATPPVDSFEGRMYERCAVVGNSGLLRHYHFGAEIDSHDLVLRFNLAPTKTFGEFVGSRTDMRLLNTLHLGKHEADELGVQQMQSRVGVSLYLKFREEHADQREGGEGNDMASALRGEGVEGNDVASALRGEGARGQ